MDQSHQTTSSTSTATPTSPPPPPPPSQEAQKQKQEDEEQQEEGECGFCLFMKAGGCKEDFVAWEDCVAAAEKSGEDVVERCFQATAALRKCMEAHAEYYEPVLRAEKAMAEELEAQLQDENNKEAQIQYEDKENKEAQIQEEREEKERVEVRES